MRSGAEDAAARINGPLWGFAPWHGVKSGTLRVFGDWFGRPYDNVHSAVSATADGDLLVVTFDEGERLSVWRPEGVAITRDEFRIRAAERVRWEWYSYGDPRTPENLCVEEHWVEGGAVRATSTAHGHTRAFAPSLAEPAVELL